MTDGRASPSSPLRVLSMRRYPHSPARLMARADRRPWSAGDAARFTFECSASNRLAARRKVNEHGEVARRCKVIAPRARARAER